MQENTGSKNYAIHTVKVSRPDKHVGKTFDHTGFDYEKGAFKKQVNTTPAHAEEMNAQSHNTNERYYEIAEAPKAAEAE